jgi:hypothetical protein
MHRYWAWGVAVAVTAAAGAAASGAPKDKSPAPQVRPPVIVEPLPPDVLAEAVRAEQDAYIRRLDVCTRLREIAAEKADDKLTQQAAELEKQAFALYEARVAKLGVKPTGRPAPAAEAALDKALGSGAAVNPLTVAPPAPAGASVAQLREVKP